MQSLTVIVMNQFLLPYGNDKIAAMGIASKVSMIAQLVLVGFSFGGIPLFGYLYGAKKRDVMRKLIRFCLTAHKAPQWMLDAADYSTEMKCRRHPYQKGIKARKGIEY